ncbi:MAG: hypothetical protein Q9187_007967, partial [Circinaria calcarea]
FADVHYYFAEPVARPLHHRFDKASYVYLYRDAINKRGRLEIANHAGTPEQDAFTGLVDGYQAGSTPQPTSKTRSEHHWRLPSTDPRDEGNFLFRLHTFDLYFWTNEDAGAFVGNIQKTLKQEQLEILDAPPTPAPTVGLMSPVVQQLESIAITDPAYHNGNTRNSRTASIPTLPRPSTVEEPAKAHTPLASKEEKKSYAPLAYNPAAPAAPEPIKHREKTPPPPEAIVGTGLAAAAYQDQLHGHAQQPLTSLPPPPPPPPGSHAQSSQPVGAQSHYASSGYTSPSSSGFDPQSPFSQGHRASSMSSPQAPPVQSPPINPYFPHHAASSGSASGPGSAAQSQMQLMRPSSISHTHDSNAHLYSQGAAPLESPTVQILGSSYVAPPPQPLQHLQPQYADYLASHTPPQQPIGSYSDYKYDEPHRHHGHHSHNQDQEIHSQVYRPTEEESRHHRHRNSGASGSSPGQQPGKLEQKAEKYEKGVNRFLRKLEKRIG